VGGSPDFTLTIWNWKQEKIILRNKAFSQVIQNSDSEVPLHRNSRFVQDIYRVEFSPDNDGQLTTSGMAHIKFWKISSTFTGLKLQGQLGKFGATGISDISAFIHLPDGKVLSGTETGNMLLWDEGLIKCEIGVIGKKLCHQGTIEVVLLEEGEVITAGEDGFVRIWDFETIDNADIVDTNAILANPAQGSQPAAAPNPSNAPNSVSPSNSGKTNLFEMEPLDEILIGKDVKVRVAVVSAQDS
jgi:WD40 repeat protein